MPTNPTYNDITQWKKIPLSELKIHTGLSDDSVGLVTFGKLEDGSTFMLRPVLTDNDTGGQSIVGWIIEVEAIVLQNNYEDMLPTLQAFSFATITDLDLKLQADSEDVGGEKLWITADETLDVDDINVSWHIDYQTYPGPKLVIKVREILSVEAISMETNTLFVQYWESS